MRNRSDTRTLRALSKAGRKQNAFGGFDNDSYCVPFPLRALPLPQGVFSDFLLTAGPSLCYT